mmetsp:Transcript_24651/g.30734  ORF Transcript_24651/g.30734 Transcript_24651/m.30734 type:complete len:86 (-) Transcript_24651:381-638(-)
MNDLVEQFQGNGKEDNCPIPGEQYYIKSAPNSKFIYLRCTANCGFRIRFMRDEHGYIVRSQADTISYHLPEFHSTSGAHSKQGSV